MERFGRFQRTYPNNPRLIATSIAVFVPAHAALERLNALAHLPLFMDSIFTAIGAALFGTLPGVITGVLANPAMDLGYGLNGQHAPFAVCSVAAALIAGGMVAQGRF